LANGTAPTFTVPAWCDAPVVYADALGVLRLNASDPDAARLAEHVNVAAALVDAWLDRPAEDPLPPVSDTEPMNPLARYGCTNVTIELYRRKDAPFGVLNAWSPDELVTRINTDPIRGSFHILLPLKGGWGVCG
jgi:hypothetical protein